MANNAEELIVPKKLANPVKENTTRRELHRELMFNQKIGKSVLNQKSELQRVMESKKFNLKSTGFNDPNGENNKQDLNNQNEFMNVHRRITSHNNQDDH
ncbi:unnamed protein product [Allacma fusca]|uniref:Uncharacterized protein n=1 Tax=Allacma fusca TaxID=39272 RepID=A0A8J2J1H4_9HEXA|nr:unnamed protein product [Allacma fusca]